MASQTRGNNRAPAPQVVLHDQVLHHVNQNPEMRADLIQRTNLLRGVIVTPDGLRPSTWGILDIRDELPVSSMNETTYGASCVKNSHADMFIKRGWSRGMIDACAPWIFLTCGVPLRDYGDDIYGCAFAHHVRGVVDFSIHKIRSSVRSEFKDAVVTALQAATREEVQKGLKAVFNRSGHLFQTRIWLGLVSQCFGSAEVIEYDECAKRIQLLGALSNSLREGQGVQCGSVEVVHGTKTTTVYYQTKGGEPSGLGNASSWLQSAERYQSWAVIKVEKAVPIIELLEPELCQRVIGAFAPLIGKWVTPTLKNSTPGKSPDMTAHPGWYWLCQTKTALEGESPAKSLIVQDRTGTSLVPPISVDLVEKGQEISAYKLTTSRTPTFIVLGAFLWDKSKLPDFGRLRAVKKDLLVHGSVATAGFISDTVSQLVVQLPGTAVALGDPVHAIETKHIILQTVDRFTNEVTLTPDPLLLSKYAIDIQGTECVVST